MRFTTTESKDNTQSETLKGYLERAKDAQDKIYYIAAENLTTAKNSPHLEIFKKKGIEVLLLTDRVDEWLMSHLQEFDGKTFQDIGRGQLDLGEIEDEEDKKQQETLEKNSEDLIKRIKDALSDDVQEVRVTHRLTDSPACLVVGEHDMGAQMKRIMEQAGQAIPDSKPIFEVNPEHALVKRLDQESDEDRFNDLTSILFDQASLAEGGHLEDPASYVQKLNKLLLEMTQ